MKNRAKSFLLLSSLITLIISCGKQVPVGKFQTSESSIIVGDVNWRDVTELSSNDPKRVSSRAVIDVQFANGGRCSGFLISDKVMMTNQHCILSASDVVGMKVFTRHEAGVSKAEWAEIKCNKFLGNDEVLDFALVECEGTPGAQYGKVELDESTPEVGEEVYVIHQNCDYYTKSDCDWSKKLSEGSVMRIEEDIHYDADTLGGSSGSAVFRELNNKVVGIHHFGHGGGWTGRGESNSAVPMKKIVPVIKARFPQVLAAAQAPTEPTEPTTPVMSDDNATYAKATVLSKALSVKGLSISSATDVDMYKVSLKAGEVLNFVIKFSHAQGDIDFKVYRESASGATKTLVKKVESSTNDESIKLKVSTTANYYVRVYGYKGAQADYDLEFSAK